MMKLNQNVPKIIYLKNTNEGKLGFFNPYFYKCIDNDYLTVTEESIYIDGGDDFHDNVSFIKEKLCERQWEEITREEFDDFYKETTEKINNLSKL